MRVRLFLSAALLLAASIAAEAQATIYWVKDRITDPGGAVIDVAAPQPSDTTAPNPPTSLETVSASSTLVKLKWTASTSTDVAGYRVYRGPVLIGTPAAAGTQSAPFEDPAVIGNTEYLYSVVAVDTAGNRSTAATLEVTTPANPTGLAAGAVSSSQVNLTWTAAGGTIDHYVVERKTTGSWSSVGTPSSNSYSDTSVSAGTAYLYRVKAVDAQSVSSSYTNTDLATTVAFTDGTITAGSTVIKAAHISELRTAVNAVRATAGLSAASWTDSTLTAGSTGIKAAHISELRSNLSSALTTLGFSAPSFTDSTLTAGSTVIKRVHVIELRQYVN